MTSKVPLFFILALFIPGAALAAGPVIRTGDTVSVDASQVIEGDFYGLAPAVTLSGSAQGDAVILGGKITINGPVQGDLILLGGSAQIHGDVADDLRIIGGDAVLGKTVKGDVVVVGGTLTVLSTAKIEGDLIFMGGELTVEGEVAGGIHGAADRALINAPIGKDVSLSAESLLSLGAKADIKGGVTYKSRNELARSQDAKVAGSIQHSKDLGEVGRNSFRTVIMLGLSLAFGALSLYLISRRLMQTVIDRSRSGLGLMGLLGLGILLVVPFVIGIFVISLIGGLFGVTLLLGYILLLALALALSGSLLGVLVRKILTKRTELTLATVCFGTLGYVALGMIPVIGGILMFALFVITLGGLGSSIYRALRP